MRAEPIRIVHDLAVQITSSIKLALTQESAATTTTLLGSLKRYFFSMCASLGNVSHALVAATLLPCVVIHTVFSSDNVSTSSHVADDKATPPPPDTCDLLPLKELPLPPFATPLSRPCFDQVAALGAGPFGTVKLVRHKVSGQQFALKIIDKASIPTIKLARQVVRERDIVMSVQHPLVATCFGSFQDDRHVYLVSEYLPGGDLYQHLFDGAAPRALDVAAIRFYAANMVKAVQGLHDQGIVYRDLKMENTMVDATGYIKLIDMGFAKAVDNNGRTLTVCGTPEYMLENIVTYPVSAGALGVVLYEMAMDGDSLFYHDSHARMMARIKAVATVGLPTAPAFDLLDPTLQSFIKGLLAFDPTGRLGCTAASFSAIEDHPFFHGYIDWAALMAKEVPAPFVPDAPTDRWWHALDEFDDDDPIQSDDVDPKIALVFEGF
ncbi:hypothetical protein DYB30_007789 [Aphanomyces astaci]|uniref:AGC/PKA protein kinase n=1 Tax=Aphanomyces astaci TaxID=112090 RepID=A0A397F658_APHAT|nr:hypothetical protein DYB34_005914 [Aphanomyces astaci]RHY72386.1 hypothetical protein DYB30_007789 [Aphanomyces astaci]RHZ09746.1 hypothetical protein DYB31_007812 [Aphanomyces astaci]RHZ24056.1 hypothetical protein DYB26_002132 [Aphanomyces astaci]